MATQNPNLPIGTSTSEMPFTRSNDDAGTSSAAPLDRIVTGAHDVVDRLAMRAQPAIDTLNSKAADLTTMRDEWLTHCRSEVRAHPLASVALGLLAGVLVGKLLAR